MAGDGPEAQFDVRVRRPYEHRAVRDVEFARLAGPSREVTDTEIAAFATGTSTRIVVTLGERGAALLANDGVVHRVPAPTVTALDTTGAGDAFVGAFAYGLAKVLDDLDCQSSRIGAWCALA